MGYASPAGAFEKKYNVFQLIGELRRGVSEDTTVYSVTHNLNEISSYLLVFQMKVANAGDTARFKLGIDRVYGYGTAGTNSVAYVPFCLGRIVDLTGEYGLHDIDLVFEHASGTNSWKYIKDISMTFLTNGVINP